MAAHRYWRAKSFETYSPGPLRLTEFQLLANTSRVDTSASLTANIAPLTGSLTDLYDDSSLTGATWDASVVGSLVLSWDFSSTPADVTDIRLGSGPDIKQFPLIVLLQYSDDNLSWSDYFLFSAIRWPGASAKTSSFDPTGKWSLSDKNPALTVSSDQTVLGAPVALSTAGCARALVSKSSGLVQFEASVSFTAGNDIAVGVGTSSVNLSSYVGSSVGGFSYNRNGNKYLAGAATAYGATYVTGDVIGTVVDFGTGSLTFYKNGVSQGVASATGMLGLTLFPMAGPTSTGVSNALFTLRGRGFTYPIAGASEWSSLPLITREFFLVRSASGIRSVSAAATPTPTRALLQSGSRGRNDYYSGLLGNGVGRINGRTMHAENPNVPVGPRRVRLHRKKDGYLVRETFSDPVTGAYSFDYIDEAYTYYVVAFDHTNLNEAVIADNRIPSIIPGV